MQRLGGGAFGVGQGAQAAQHLDLQVVERVDVGIAQAHGVLGQGLFVQKLRVAADF